MEWGGDELMVDLMMKKKILRAKTTGDKDRQKEIEKGICLSGLNREICPCPICLEWRIHKINGEDC